MGALDEFKRNAALAGKDYLTELVLEYERDVILTKIARFFKEYTAEDIAKHIAEANLIPPPEALIDWLKGYKSQVARYSLKDMAERLLEWLAEVRPDIVRVLMSSDEAGAMWLTAEAQVIRNGVLEGKSEVKEPEKKIEFTRASCEKCGEIWLVSKEKADKITRCPFCGEEQGVEKESSKSETPEG